MTHSTETVTWNVVRRAGGSGWCRKCLIHVLKLNSEEVKLNRWWATPAPYSVESTAYCENKTTHVQ